MSLLLRKKSQEVLDQFKLSNFHTAICEHTKFLKIVSECGKPFITIVGIKFNKITPSNAEIDYAAELLISFLNAHIVEIETYLILLAAFKKKPEVKSNINGFKIIKSVVNKENYFRLFYCDDIFNCMYSLSEDIITASTITVNNNNEIKTEELINFKFNMTRFKEAKQHLLNYKKYIEEKENIQKIKDTLSVCTI